MKSTIDFFMKYTSKILLWVTKNKEWLFSGIGIAIIIAIYGLVNVSEKSEALSSKFIFSSKDLTVDYDETLLVLAPKLY